MGYLHTGQPDSLYQRMESLVLRCVMQGQQRKEPQVPAGVLKVLSVSSSRRATNPLAISSEGTKQGLVGKPVHMACAQLRTLQSLGSWEL